MKPIQGVAGSRKDLEGMAREVRREMRIALFAAQNGQTAGSAKRMRDELRDVMEITISDRGGAFRGMYYAGTESIYALHFFQKKKQTRHRDAETRDQPHP